MLLCEPLTSARLLQKLLSGRLAAEACCLCLCEESLLLLTERVTLRDESNNQQVTLEEIVNEFGLIQISDVISQRICEPCADKIIGFHLFKNDCTKIALAFKNFINVFDKETEHAASIKRGEIGIVLPFHDIVDYADKYKVNKPKRKSRYLNLKSTQQCGKCAQIVSKNGYTKITKTYTKHTHKCVLCKVVFDNHNHTIAHLNKHSNAELTANGIKSTDDQVFYCVPCNLRITSWKQYLEHKNVHMHEMFTQCIVKNDTFCACCLRISKQLVKMSQEVTFASVQMSVSKLTLESIMCGILNTDKLERINPLLICEKCIEKCLIAYNFKNIFEQSTRIIQNSLTHLDQCLDGITNVDRLPLEGYAVKIRIHFDPKKLSQIKQSDLNREDISDQVFNENLAGNRKIKCKKNVIYECPQCFRDFTTQTLWIEHRRSHDRTENYICRICKSKFTDLERMKAHKLTHRSSDVVVCYICMQYLPRQELSKHLYKTHEEKKLTCNYCGKFLFLKSAMAKHMLKHHLTQSKKSKMTCKQCNVIIQSSKAHRCPYSCLDCAEYPCIHQKYLLAYRDEELKQPKSQHKCVDCDFMYSMRPNLLAHVNEVHLSHYPHQCAECGARFPSKQKLRNHKVHLSFMCQYCCNTFTSKDYLNRHMVVCANLVKSYQCDVCNGKFETSGKLEYHRKKHGMNCSSQTYKCKDCDEKFSTERKYKVHKKKHFLKKRLNKSRDSGKLHKCDICEKAFETEDKLAVHKKTHVPKEFKCASCLWRCWSQEELDEHISRRHNNIQAIFIQKSSIWCSMCMLEFETLRERIEHEIQHPVGSRHVCRFCSETFATKQERRVHLRNHAVKLDCKCDICGRMYDKYTIRQHMKVHTPKMNKNIKSPVKKVEKAKREHLTHMCDVCGVMKYSIATLKKHKRIHQMQEKCLQCFKLIPKRQYEMHLKSHESKEESCLKVYVNKFGKTRKTYYKKLECKQCDYTTLYEPCYEAHMNRHHLHIKPYKCTLCNSAFYGRLHLKEHEKIHINGKSEQCEECGLSFSCKKALKYHMRLHTGERPYACDLCDATFINTNRMNTHKARKHFKPTHPCPMCPKMFFERSSVNKHVRDVHHGKNTIRSRKKKEAKIK